MTILSKGQQVAADVSALLRARNPLLWIVTREEARVEGFIFEAAAAAGYPTHFWDVAQGVTKLDGTVETGVGSPDIEETLNAIRERATKGNERGVWVLRDLPVWLNGPIGAKTLRQVRNIVRLVPPLERAQPVIIITPEGTVPPELTGHATVIEFPLPDRTEIAALLDGAVNALPIKDKEGNPLRAVAAPNGVREAAINAAIGLSAEEAAASFSRSLVQTRRIDPILVATEKKRVIARERVLEWYDPLPGGLDAVGGLENVKAWLMQRKSAFSKEAREYGVPTPLGIMVVGVSGCGKTLLAQATSTAYQVPLLKFDLGALKGKFVGESEANIRKAFRTIEAVGRCVVWLDEVEKGLQGATSGASDGGVSADALGAILTWMQERRGQAFIIATANDVSALPPEFLRAGRFDVIWFVDVPTFEERKSVLKAALAKYGRPNAKIDFAAVAKACPEFTGAEIAAIVPDAMFAAFNDGAREITTADLTDAASNVVPLTMTAAEKIKTLRQWAKGRARPATKPVLEAVQTNVRALDL